MLRTFLKYQICLWLAIGCSAGLAAAQQNNLPGTTDTAVSGTDTSKRQKLPKAPYPHQFRAGADVSRIAFNMLYSNKQSYEFQADYALRGKSYLAAEAGWGNGKVDYDNLKYSTNGAFVRLGIENSILDRLGETDFDMAFIGVRYGLGVGKRSEASYKISSIFGAAAEGTIPASSYTAHWGEILGGIKVELWKGVFAGWTARAKFLFNSGSFKELAPSFIPGYGPGDRSTAFDFNMYLSYAIRWLPSRSGSASAGPGR